MIRLATAEDMPATTAMVARAFLGDAMLRWTLRDDGTDGFAARVRRFFELNDPMAQALGYMWVTQDLAGSAEWIPPGVYGLGEEGEAHLWDALVELLPDDGVRFEEFWTWADAHRPQEPHWYLHHIAVDEGHRGRGLAAALIEQGLTSARRDGVPAHLETSTADLARYYERRGFRVEAEGDGPDGGPHAWFMRFDP